VNTSCFACRGGECSILLPKKASCEGCRFFKTKRRAKAGRKHAQRLIAAKPAEQQRYIAEKYYGGTMPWKEGTRRES